MIPSQDPSYITGENQTSENPKLIFFTQQFHRHPAKMCVHM